MRSKTMKDFHFCAHTILLLFLALIITQGQSADLDELSRLRISYESAIERAVSPLEKRYLDHLRKLQNKYTRQNKLDDAIRVRDDG